MRNNHTSRLFFGADWKYIRLGGAWFYDGEVVAAMTRCSQFQADGKIVFGAVNNKKIRWWKWLDTNTKRSAKTLCFVIHLNDTVVTGYNMVALEDIEETRTWEDL